MTFENLYYNFPSNFVSVPEMCAVSFLQLTSATPVTPPKLGMVLMIFP